MGVDLGFRDEPLEKALRALGGDASAGPALELIAGTEDAHRREHVVASLGAGGVGRLDQLRAVALQREYEPERWLLLGAALAAASWQARDPAGGRRGIDGRIREQQALVAEARGALRRAAGLGRDDPVPWSELAGVAFVAPRHATEAGDALRRAAIIAPDLYLAHARHLTGLAPRWGGGMARVMAFARARAAGRPDGHPLLALVALAHTEGYVDALLRGGAPGRYWRAWRYLAGAGVRGEIDAAADRLLAGAGEYGSHPATPAAHRAFAALYRRAGEPGRARLFTLAGKPGEPGEPGAAGAAGAATGC